MDLVADILGCKHTIGIFGDHEIIILAFLSEERQRGLQLQRIFTLSCSHYLQWESVQVPLRLYCSSIDS